MIKKKLSFVIGLNYTGKTYFINHHFEGKDVKNLDIFTYQNKAYDEAGYKDRIPLGEEFQCLYKANKMHIQAIIEELKNGHDVVAEQTFFKAKRRISYIDAIRKEVNAEIEVYVICPGDERWAKNIMLRNSRQNFQSLKEMASEFEFPNPAEGFDAIYEVTDGKISLRMDEPNPELLEKSRREIAEETERIQREDEKKRKKTELLESMKTRPFWHYCEVCGKKEYLTAQDAYKNGWDYPPTIGSFGLSLAPRICGNCPTEGSFYWKLHNDKERFPVPLVISSLLTREERIIWNRIKAEPESLLEEETDEILAKYAGDK